MIECVFTIDYEIYGDGQGSLSELVYEPTSKLVRIFEEAGARFVCFVEAAELEKIEQFGTDGAIRDVRRQILELHQRGFEIALHLHPQWYNASYRNGQWWMDYSEYNLCTLPKSRIVHMVERAIGYLRDILGMAAFTPLSFRAGNWLFQPTEAAASVLAERGIKIDSSVFKGGCQRKLNLDYRKALKNGYYWTFADHVDSPDPMGKLLELPIYSQMVPFWRMLTRKRVGLQQRRLSVDAKMQKSISRFFDFLRLKYPLKFDFCRMTFDELTSMLDRVIREDQASPTSLKPIVAIGHSKDLIDFETIGSFLSCLRARGIAVSTFEGIYPRCRTMVESVRAEGKC
jgi:peptidoglycan/xylan/chitin deacetylase (PgdA/CDA1 family)